MTDPHDGPDPARARFAVISAARIIAAALIAFGIVIAYGRLESVEPAIALPLGVGMIAIGIIDMIVVVPMLVRRWRSGGDR
ncbi:MAG: hypothetical protein ABL874_02170 [Sphingopyxis sp.]